MPDGLHPGARIAIAKLGMDELGIARAMAAGELTSPQKYRGLTLFNMRVTGTGLAYRTAHEEFVWRDPSIYMNDEFLARCNGLEVIWEHPNTQVLDSEEFAQRIVGSVMLPYLKPDIDEVWAIARIRDAEAARLMEDGKLSTSPSVVLSDDRNTTVRKFRDGKPLLVEGKPELLDHLAICEQGVWDKGGDPVGVDSNSGDNSMPDDPGKMAADADAGQKLDGILEHLKLGNARLDSLSEELKGIKARQDAMDRSRKRDDSAEGRRARDDAGAMEAMSDDDDAKHDARMDAEEETERKEFEEEGEPKEVAADKAKRRRADKAMWRADRRKADAARRHDAATEASTACMDDDDDAKFGKRMDAEEEEEAKKVGADAAKRHRADKEKWRADRRARADSASRHNDARVSEMVAKALETRLPKPDSDADRSAKADAQFRADSVYSALGLGGAPPAMQGETVRDYRLRLTGKLKVHSTAWKGIDLALLPGDAFAIAETTIRADALVASRNPTDVPAGQLRERRITDPVTNMTTTEFVGPTTFIGLMKRPSQRLAGKGFKTGREG